MIKLNHITKRFESGDRTVTAVDDVSLAINAGEVFGIIGFSGAGSPRLCAASICSSGRLQAK